MAAKAKVAPKTARHQRFRELLAKIPTNGTTPFKIAAERLDWLVANLYCSRQTARVWCMKEPHRVIPAAKLRFMADKLAA